MKGHRIFNAVYYTVGVNDEAMTKWSDVTERMAYMVCADCMYHKAAPASGTLHKSCIL